MPGMTRARFRPTRGVGSCLLALAAALSALACIGPPDSEALAPCPAERPSLASAASGAPAPALSAGDPAAGERVFQEHCARCHAPHLIERSSRLFFDYPRLDCPNYLEATSDEDLTAIILNGGEAFGLIKAMKPFADVLEPGEVADVVAYVRSGAASR